MWVIWYESLTPVLLFHCVGSCSLFKSKVPLYFQIVYQDLSEPSDRMLDLTILQQPCNKILCAGPTGQIVGATQPLRPPQHFPPPQPIVKNMGDNLMTSSLLLKVTCTRVCFLHCPVPDKLTQRANIDPELHESCTTVRPRPARILPRCQLFAAADSGSLFWVDWLSWNVIPNRQQHSVSPPRGVYYFFSNCSSFL